jgi:hypothetical protein
MGHATENDDAQISSHHNKTTSLGGRRIPWPLPPLVVLAMLPLLPTSFYLNRGYTIWFHLLSFAYFLTRSTFLRKVLILQGMGICAGWYSVIPFDYFVDGTFCHVLYRNMPDIMLPHMVHEPNCDGDVDENCDYVIFDTFASTLMKGLSHVLDILAHPGLLCLFYQLHRSAGGTLREVFDWPVIVVAWHLSRMWSVVHSHHNDGTLAFWYYGYDVYKLANLNSYLVSYIAEGACFCVAISCRICWDCIERQVPSKNNALSLKSMRMEGGKEDSMPTLVHSMHSMSTSSMTDASS